MTVLTPSLGINFKTLLKKQLGVPGGRNRTADTRIFSSRRTSLTPRDPQLPYPLSLPLSLQLDPSNVSKTSVEIHPSKSHSAPPCFLPDKFNQAKDVQRQPLFPMDDN